ncbi:MAG: response regulator [Acidimicrobiia bacterium]|nr:response regulator [Acidimicrobiia bacterium]
MAGALTILLAEDNLVIQRMMSVTLARQGYTVETANNGHEAVAAVQFGSFDLILMDLRMPVMDGFEATQEIRRLGITQPPILALSGDDDAATVQSCLDAGMNGHVTKPIVMRDLVAAIDRATGPA